jgi:hypothetical protein
MLIAIVNGQTVEQVGDYQVLFPNTSFPSSGPTDEWMAETGCMKVNLYKPYDIDTQKLVSVLPYIEEEWVYTVQVEQLSTEELQQIENTKKSQNKNQAQTLLQQTDWVEIPSVSDSSNTPHLTNKSEFDTYRLSLRVIAVNPTVTVEWPEKPTEQWSS